MKFLKIDFRGFSIYVASIFLSTTLILLNDPSNISTWVASYIFCIFNILNIAKSSKNKNKKFMRSHLFASSIFLMPFITAAYFATQTKGFVSHIGSYKFNGCFLNKGYTDHYQSIDYEKIQDPESIVTIKHNNFSAKDFHILATPSFSPKQQECIAQVVSIARDSNRKIIIEIPQKIKGK